MIVERITWLAKVGHCMEVVKLLKDFNQGVGGTYRICTCMFGAEDEAVVVELEFETMEDRRKSWEQVVARPDFGEVTQKMRELIRSGGVHEIWRLH